ncbi:MAG: winged helix-turn-helix transcriptional regulator [Elusimicrobia bacterium]|nr:winged helix-turn-helix transcriptional regulator [Elusimicrobiota bacterium]
MQNFFVKTIVDEFKTYDLIAPEFKEVGENFMVTVYKARLSNITQRKSQKKVTVKVPEKVTVKVPEKVTTNQNKILKKIAGNSRITAKELAVVVGISERKIKENIGKLKEKRLLCRIGPDRGGHWEIIDRQRTK